MEIFIRKIGQVWNAQPSFQNTQIVERLNVGGVARKTKGNHSYHQNTPNHPYHNNTYKTNSNTFQNGRGGYYQGGSRGGYHQQGGERPAIGPVVLFLSFLLCPLIPYVTL